MTEDDTFAALNPLPIEEVLSLWNDATHIPSPAGSDNSIWKIDDPVPSNVTNFFRQYGWTYKRFLNEAYPPHIWRDMTWRR